jgi:hypothetical protein
MVLRCVLENQIGVYMALAQIGGHLGKDPKAARSEALKVSQLIFDSDNPRFPKDIASGPTEQLLERFIRDERLQEIVDSIGNHGFFPGEPLLVIGVNSLDSNNDEVYKVVEGNRRLAALKLLTKELETPSARTSIEKSVESAIYRPSTVPCLIFDDEKEVLRYLGFRHITGIKAWGALQKARYAQRLWKEYSGIPVEQGLKELAKEIGSRPDYVGQMLTSLAVYDALEADSFLGLELSPEDIEFSILSTALSYANIVDFLGLESRSDLNISNLSKANAKDLFDWLFVSRNGQKPVVNESRELRRLAAVVASPEAVWELRNSRQLNSAFEVSKGPEIALAEALRGVNNRIQSALALLSKTKRFDEDHQKLAAQIFKTARTISASITEEIESQEIANIRNGKAGDV